MVDNNIFIARNTEKIREIEEKIKKMLSGFTIFEILGILKMIELDVLKVQRIGE